MATLKRYNGESWEYISGSSGQNLDNITAEDVSYDSTASYSSGTVGNEVNSKITMPNGGSIGDILKKTENGTEWATDAGDKQKNIYQQDNEPSDPVAGDLWIDTDAIPAVIDFGLDNKEDISNKVTSISSDSTDTQYPSAKCVYNAIAAGGNSAFELLWVNNTAPLDSFTNAQPTVTGKSFADYDVFLLFYKDLWNYYANYDPDYLTQTLFKGVDTRIEMRGYEIDDSDQWRSCRVTDSGFTVTRRYNSAKGTTTDASICVPFRLYGFKNVTFDTWV